MKMFSTITGALTINNVNFLSNYVYEISNGVLSWFSYDNEIFVYMVESGELVDSTAMNIHGEVSNKYDDLVERFLECGCSQANRTDLVDYVYEMKKEMKNVLYDKWRSGLL